MEKNQGEERLVSLDDQVHPDPSTDHEHCPRCPACGLHKHKGTCEDFVNTGQPDDCKDEH